MTNQYKKFYAAAERLIAPQLLRFAEREFIRHEKPKCPLTDKPLTWENSAVDYKGSLNFGLIVMDFLESNRIALDNIEFKDEKLKNAYLAQRFIEFHAARKDLQLVYKNKTQFNEKLSGLTFETRHFRKD